MMVLRVSGSSSNPAPILLLELLLRVAFADFWSSVCFVFGLVVSASVDFEMVVFDLLGFEESFVGLLVSWSVLEVVEEVFREDLSIFSGLVDFEYGSVDLEDESVVDFVFVDEEDFLTGVAL